MAFMGAGPARIGHPGGTFTGQQMQGGPATMPGQQAFGGGQQMTGGPATQGGFHPTMGPGGQLINPVTGGVWGQGAWGAGSPWALRHAGQQGGQAGGGLMGALGPLGGPTMQGGPATQAGGPFAFGGGQQMQPGPVNMGGIGMQGGPATMPGQPSFGMQPGGGQMQPMGGMNPQMWQQLLQRLNGMPQQGRPMF